MAKYGYIGQNVPTQEVMIKHWCLFNERCQRIMIEDL